MATTYDPIATTTLGSTASSITFSSIPSTYTDLVIIFTGKSTSTSDGINLTLNSNTTLTYSMTAMPANGSTVLSGGYVNGNGFSINYSDTFDTTVSFSKIDIFSYSSSLNKTCLISWNHDKNGSGYNIPSIGLWRNAAVVSTVTLTATVSFAAGTTATIYGIKAA